MLQLCKPRENARPALFFFASIATNRTKPVQTHFKSSIHTACHLFVWAVLLISASTQAQNLFVADGGSGNIYTFSPSGEQSPFASGFVEPFELAFNHAGDLFVANNAGNNIVKITPGGVQSVFPWG